jgi:hypothetical protein
MFTVCGAPMYAGCVIPTLRNRCATSQEPRRRGLEQPTVSPGWSIRDAANQLIAECAQSRWGRGRRTARGRAAGDRTPRVAYVC